MSVLPTYPSGYAGAQVTLAQMRTRSDVQMLDPEFRRRVFAMMRAARRAGVPLGIGGAGRSTAQQTALFLARHYEDPNGAIYWNGKRWTRKAGVAAAAPPGLSYHEETTPTGGALAVDMVPPTSLAWMAANCARFGLVHLGPPSPVNELWHVQPADVPASRRSYNALWHHPLPRLSFKRLAAFLGLTK